MIDLTSLIERLEKAEAGDIAFNAEIELIAYGDLLDKCKRVADHTRQLGWKWVHPIDGVLTEPEPYTTSLDTAIALMERCLEYPELVIYSLEKTDLSDRPYSVVLKRKKFDPNPWIMRLSQAYAKTAPLAFCVALLKVLQVKECAHNARIDRNTMTTHEADDNNNGASDQ